MRDLELEYLEQVERVIDAADALEAGTFEPTMLTGVMLRTDELGRLARTFSRMAPGAEGARRATAGRGSRASHRDR